MKKQPVKIQTPAKKKAPAGVSVSRQLTPKQQLFVLEYLIDLNATQAAIRAGFSKKTAEWIGPQVLGKTHVAAAIQEAMNKRAARIEITGDKVLQELAKLSFANLQDFYNKNGSFKEIHELPRDVAAALLSVKVNYTSECAIQEVKLHDKKGSLELLGRHLKLWKDVGSADNPLTAESLSDSEIDARLAELEAKS